MNPAIPSKAHPLAEQLAAVGAQLHVVLAHLEACGAPDPPAALAELLDAILVPLARRRPADAVLAADLLADVGGVLGNELVTLSG